MAKSRFTSLWSAERKQSVCCWSWAQIWHVRITFETTPLSYAANNGVAGCLKAVTDAVFDFSTSDFGGQTILHHAVYAELQSREKLETCLGKGLRRRLSMPRIPRGLHLCVRRLVVGVFEGNVFRHFCAMVRNELNEYNGDTTLHCAAYKGNCCN